MAERTHGNVAFGGVRKATGIVFLALIYGWLSLLAPQATGNTYYSVYFSVYVLCALLAVVCAQSLAGVARDCRSRKHIWVTFGLSCFLSLLVVLANYDLLDGKGILQGAASLGVLLAGGICVAWPTVLWLVTFLPRPAVSCPRQSAGRAFALSFCLIALVDLGYLFGVQYPGVLTKDSLSTIGQILGIYEYNNVMPYWHTKLVEVFFRLGMALTGDINGAVATFHVAQILLMAGCFSYGVMTVYQLGVPRWNLLLFFAFYCLMPYHIAYSVTLWKDVPFAGALLLMLVALYRVMHNLGTKPWVDQLLMIVGAVGFSLLRTNGWYVLLATVVIMAFVRRGGSCVLMKRMILVLLATWVMLNPLLDSLGVKGMDMTEAFAVPMQQIARIVSQGRELTEEQNQVLGEIFDLEKMAQLYDPNSVDPVKFKTFRYGKKSAIQQDPWRYIRVYLEIGAQYPGEYLKAWVEETKGFWNAGYSYMVYDNCCEGEELGIARRTPNSIAQKCYGLLFRVWEKATSFQFTASIGLFVWVLLVLFVVACLKGWEEKILFLPVLVIIEGLWLGTPVFAEFRYAYPIILAVPFLFEVCAYHPEMK